MAKLTKAQQLKRLQVTCETIEELEPQARQAGDTALLEAIHTVSPYIRERYAALNQGEEGTSA